LAEYRVFDADGHFDEPQEIWPQYLEPQFRELAPRFVRDSQGRPCMYVGGEVKEHIPMPPGHRAGDAMAGGRDPHVRLADMNKEGIDVMVMYPTTGLFFFGLERLDVTAALCRAYNNWAHDFCSVAPERLFAPVILPQMDVPESIAETRRAAEKLGLRGVVLRPNPVAGRTLDHPAFSPLWSLLEELDVPLVLHEGTTQDVPQVASDRYQNFMFRHLISHAFEQQLGLMSLICGGVLERHPGLRVLIVEAGVGWVPYWLDRMDHHIKEWGFASAPLRLKPSEYFARQCYVAADAEERLLPQVISAIGDDNLCFSTDYPHPDHPFEGVVAELADRPDVSEASKRKILYDNAARVFKLD
jgi:predicted TIM-barrel fold metal-dependent hydrolase